MHVPSQAFVQVASPICAQFCHSRRRCIRAKTFQTPTNGAAAKEAKIFRTVEVDGVKYVSVAQVCLICLLGDG